MRGGADPKATVWGDSASRARRDLSARILLSRRGYFDFRPNYAPSSRECMFVLPAANGRPPLIGGGGLVGLKRCN